MWGIPAAVFFIAFLHRVVPGIVAKDVMQAFGATGAIVGLLSSMYFYSYAGFMIPAGLLIDGFGARVMITAGAAVMGAGSLAMGVAAAEPLLFAGRFVVGLGATVTFIGALKIGAAWFPPSQFATLAAVTATVGVLGSIAGTYPLAALVAAAGWRGAFLILGLLTLVLAALCALLVRDHPAGSAAAEEPAPSLAGMVRGMIVVLGNRHTWPPFLAFFFAYAAMGNQMLWIVPYLRDVYGLSTTRAALYASAPALAMLASGPLTGYLSDRVVRRRKLPYTVLSAVTLVIWIAFVATLGTLPLGGVFALLFAMGLAGGAFVLTWPLGREVNPPSLSGIAVAVVNLGGFLGAALTQGPLGAVLDARWTGVSVAGARVYPLAAYQAAFSVCAGFALVALLVTLGLRETRGREHSPPARSATPRPARRRPRAADTRRGAERVRVTEAGGGRCRSRSDAGHVDHENGGPGGVGGERRHRLIALSDGFEHAGRGLAVRLRASDDALLPGDHVLRGPRAGVRHDAVAQPLAELHPVTGDQLLHLLAPGAHHGALSDGGHAIGRQLQHDDGTRRVRPADQGVIRLEGMENGGGHVAPRRAPQDTLPPLGHRGRLRPGPGCNRRVPVDTRQRAPQMRHLVPVTQDDVPDVEERLEDHDQLGNHDLIGLTVLRLAG